MDRPSEDALINVTRFLERSGTFQGSVHQTKAWTVGNVGSESPHGDESFGQQDPCTSSGESCRGKSFEGAQTFLSSPSAFCDALTLRPHSDPYSARDKKFERILAAPIVNLKELERLVWSGCPSNLRPICWKLMLGYIPPSSDRRNEVLARKRKEYQIWVKQHYEMDDADRSDEELAILHQIKIDLPRTAAQVDLFRKSEIQSSLERILYVRAIRNPATSYVQGMNDLVTPFFTVFLSEVCVGDIREWDVNTIPNEKLSNIEADCYWCLCKVLDSIQEHYTFAQPGIQKICFKLSELVRRIDIDVYKHLNEEGIDFLQFAFRWVNCLLLREIPFELVPRLWDTYFAEGDGMHDFFVYSCASLLLNWSDELKILEFQDLLMFLQCLPTSDWETSQVELLLSQAHVWSIIYPHES